MRCNPSPPAIGDRYRGPHGGTYHVRAVVDIEQHARYAWTYQVVLRWYSPRKGWRYVVESAFAFGAQLYTRK